MLDMFRQLCLDALVEEGDRNFDWRLSFEEYKLLLSDSYKPSRKRMFYQNILYSIANCWFLLQIVVSMERCTRMGQRREWNVTDGEIIYYDHAEFLI